MDKEEKAKNVKNLTAVIMSIGLLAAILVDFFIGGFAFFAGLILRVCCVPTID